MDRLLDLFRQSISSILPATASSYCREVACYLHWLAGRGLAASDATADDIHAYLNELKDRYRLSTVARKFSPIRQFYRMMVELGHMKTDPTSAIRLPLGAYEPRQRTCPAITLAERIPATTMQGVRDLAILKMMLLGCRPSQLVKLNVDDVDVDAQAVRLRERTGDRRIQPLDSATFAALRRWMALRQMLNPADNAVFISLHWTAGRSQPHQRISLRGLHQAIRRYQP
jgi:site-specific recombinase XerD